MNTRGERLSNLHWPMMGVVVLIAILGVYNLTSSAAAHEPNLYLTQLAWIGLGCLLVVGMMIPDYRVTESLAYVFYAVVCLLLVAVLGQGVMAGGARRWLAIGGVTFQPSEPAKLAVVFCLARYFSSRMQEGSYSFMGLFRPLNPSRPFAVGLVVAIFWNKPWMIDPIGELARFIHTKPRPQLDDLLWFRVGLLVCILVLAAAGVWLLRQWEQRQALLNPWPPTRRRRLTIGWLTLAFISLVAVAWVWDQPWMQDPFGVALVALHDGAATGGPFSTLQTSWWLRVLLVLGAAIYGAASALALRQGVDSWIDVAIAPIDLLALPTLLILVEPDLGTAGIVILIGLTMILIVGVQLRSLIIMGLMGAMISGVAWFGVLKDYQKRRILTFIDPEHDIQGAGWNAVQSMIAVGSGRWWGKGHMNGTQTQLSFLPEQHTDFAFSVWAEEHGFVGCMLVLILYFALLAMAFSVAAQARDLYGSLLSVGVAALILWQTVINVGMVIGIMPVVGLTLPLFSYGGSSLLTVMIGVGVLLNVHYRRRAH